MLKTTLKVFIILFSILLALVVGELYLRFFKPQPTIDNVLSFYSYSCYQALPYYFIGLKPNSNCTFSANDDAFQPFSVRVNSLGLRGEEIKKEKEPDINRILFVGDSFTFGLGVDENHTFAKVTEKILNTKIKYKKFESLNAGVPATGPGYNYLFLKNTGIKLNPDIIVVGFYPQNDIPDIISHNRITDDKNFPIKISSNTVQIKEGKLIPTYLPLKYSTPILNHFHVYSLLTNLLPNQEYKPIEQDTRTIEERIITPETCLFKKGCHDLDEEKQYAKKMYLEMKKIADKNNIEFLVVFIPAAFQVTPKSNFFTFNIPIPLMPWEQDLPYNEFSEFFKKNDIKFVRALNDLKISSKDTYYLQDNHFNANGHKIVGELISKKIIEDFYTASKSASQK